MSQPDTTSKREYKQRRQMVEYQLCDRGIKDERVLAAMSQVPRHQFIGSSWQDFAYSDRPLPIGSKGHSCVD